MAPLTERHRVAQLALRAQVLRDLSRLWPAMDWQQIDRTFPLWAEAVGALILRHRATSAGLASAYLQAFRFSEGVAGTAPVVLAPRLPDEQIRTALRVTAAVSLKAAATQGVAREQAMANAFVRSSGAVTRLVLDAGRETVRASTLADPKARGWQRVTSARACEFCQMLAGRGAVYSDRTVDFTAHDHCGCSAEPVYR
jgi:hypothetical protein